ncbi:MAG: lysophospholipid acyltransferase family protein [Polyangiales bacterium]
MHRTDVTRTTPPPFDRKVYERTLERISFLRPWFQPTIEGVENIPAERGALIVTNHGHFGLDLPVLLSLVLEATGRPVRSLGDRIVFATPIARDLAHELGAVEGEPDAAVELLKDDQLVLVYPGGAREALGEPEAAYRLQWQHSRGFVRTALRAQKPIIPVAGLGNEELYVQIVSQERMRQSGVGRLIAKFWGEKYVTPLYLGIGLLPFPTELHYIVGKPIELPYGPEAADDEEIVCALHRKVTETAQALIDHGLAKRRSTDSEAGAGSDAVVL